ncbi:MAG: hypothetical protein ACTTKH_01155 [Treponema sp.]
MINYYSLSSREDVNIAVRYILKINNIIYECSETKNIADIISQMLKDKKLNIEEVKPILSTLLIDKWHYKVTSINLSQTLKDAKKFIEKISKWVGVDIVFGYEHPELGFLVVNPKNHSSQMLLESLKKNELLVIYVGLQNKGEISEKLAISAIKTIVMLIENKKVNPLKEVFIGKFKYVERQQSKKLNKSENKIIEEKDDNSMFVAKRQLKMSKLISVVVSNELFHNGNVEAWKRIISSYCAKYQNAKVVIFYEGEHITNINTLFKWGKVRYGSSIQFAVISDIHKDLSKLSKYLKEGASPRFEAFLNGAPNSILALF